MLNGSKRELGADYQSRIYPTSVLARRASSSTPSPYCLFTWAIFLLNQHTRRCTNKAARPECRHWRRRCILEFCSASKTECRWSGSREIMEKNEKTSGNGESDKRKRLGIAAWRVESEGGKQVRKKGNMKTRDRKKIKKSLGWNATSSSCLFVVPS